MRIDLIVKRSDRETLGQILPALGESGEVLWGEPQRNRRTCCADRRKLSRLYTY